MNEETVEQIENDAEAAVDAAAEAAEAAGSAVQSEVIDPTAQALGLETQSSETAQMLVELVGPLNESIVQIMCVSFVLGSLFTVLMLLLLGFLRRNKPDA